MSPFLIAVIISFVLSLVIGFVWYSPVLFGKTWMRLQGANPTAKVSMKDMTGVMAANALATLFYVAAFTFTLAVLLPMNVFSILICVLGIYLGFTLPILAQNALWTNLPKRSAWKVFGITAGHHLVVAIVMGIIFWIVR